jgi:DNA modification methylase
LIASANLGRNGIGIEIDPNYKTIIERRLKEEVIAQKN